MENGKKLPGPADPASAGINLPGPADPASTSKKPVIVGPPRVQQESALNVEVKGLTELIEETRKHGEEVERQRQTSKRAYFLAAFALVFALVNLAWQLWRSFG